jgi:hypothetical protein
MWAPPTPLCYEADFDVGQIISLSDIFISPLEDMYAAIPPSPAPAY